MYIRSHEFRCNAEDDRQAYGDSDALEDEKDDDGKAQGEQHGDEQDKGQMEADNHATGREGLILENAEQSTAVVLILLFLITCTIVFDKMKDLVSRESSCFDPPYVEIEHAACVPLLCNRVTFDRTQLNWTCRRVLTNALSFLCAHMKSLLHAWASGVCAARGVCDCTVGRLVCITISTPDLRAYVLLPTAMNIELLGRIKNQSVQRVQSPVSRP